MPAGLANTDANLVGGPVLQEPGTYYDVLTNPVTAGTSPTTVALVGGVACLFLLIALSLGTPAVPSAYGGAAGGGTSMLEVLMWGVFIFLVAVNGLQYVYGLDIAAGVKDLLTPTPEIDIAVSPADAPLLDARTRDGGPPIPEIMIADQVFHVPDNKYTFTDAAALCQAYDARLATYDEVADAQAGGGEWCSYGWSADQLALFPTQKSTYDALKDFPGHEHDCGRPGVNGGYIANPKVRFGVNCFGNKPVITPKEQDAMRNQSMYPLTHEQIVLDKKTAKYRAKLSNIEVSPFNGQSWSRV
jgi:hypothetical protein